MLLFIILAAVVFTATAISLAVYSHIKKTERQKYYAAAGNILREDFLNYSLQNTIDPQGNVSEPKSAKMMLCLKSKSTGKKTQYVFDPEKTVKIGRDSSESNIFINDTRVSQRHCLIYSDDDTVYLQDLGSANGTFVRRGPMKRYALYDGNQIALKTGDKIIVGSSEFKVCLFYFTLY